MIRALLPKVVLAVLLGAALALVACSAADGTSNAIRMTPSGEIPKAAQEPKASSAPAFGTMAEGSPSGGIEFLYLDQEAVLAADVLDMRRAMEVAGQAQALFAQSQVRASRTPVGAQTLLYATLVVSNQRADATWGTHPGIAQLYQEKPRQPVSSLVGLTITNEPRPRRHDRPGR